MVSWTAEAHLSRPWLDEQQDFGNSELAATRTFTYILILTAEGMKNRSHGRDVAGQRNSPSTSTPCGVSDPKDVYKALPERPLHTPCHVPLESQNRNGVVTILCTSAAVHKPAFIIYPPAIAVLRGGAPMRGRGGAETAAPRDIVYLSSAVDDS